MQQQTKLTSAQPVIQVSLHVPAMKMYEWDDFFGCPLSDESKETIRSKVKERAAKRDLNATTVVWG